MTVKWSDLPTHNRLKNVNYVVRTCPVSLSLFRKGK